MRRDQELGAEVNELVDARAVVKGPLAGLNVDLGGAFGGYVGVDGIHHDLATNGRYSPSRLQLR
jgi:hypothetical protein